MRLPCEQQELRTHFLQGEAATAVWARGAVGPPKEEFQKFLSERAPGGDRVKPLLLHFLRDSAWTLS